MRIAFFGSADVGEPTLCELAKQDHEIAVVFTQPDKPAGRGGHLRKTRIKERAELMDVPVEQPETLKDGTAGETLRRYDVDLAVVVAYGHLIPKTMLEIPRHGFINLHASLLPKYRGAAPVPHAILNGEKETGLTVFRLNERFDEGDILERAVIPITLSDTSATILEKMSPIGATLVCKVVGELEAGWANFVPQIEAEATRAPKMSKDDGLIRWEQSAVQIDLACRAYQPWPLAFTYVGQGDKKLRMTVLQVEPADITALPNRAGNETPGTILAADPKTGLIVRCASGGVRLRRVRIEGKREMEDLEYLRGARLEPGMTLGL